MSTVSSSVEVDVPVGTVYNQWTQFESFPQFMDGVESITQIDDTHNHWVTKVGGVTREFDTVITEQNPDERIAWKSVGGDTGHAGVVTFHRLDDSHSRVTAQMEFEPDGAIEKAADKLGAVSHRVKGDLANFKEFIESRGTEEGGWRGDVQASPQTGTA